MRRTHKGLMFGVVPVYLDMTDEHAPGVEVRWGWLEPLLDICEGVFSVCVYLRQLVDPFYEPMFPILITGEAKSENHGPKA